MRFVDAEAAEAAELLLELLLQHLSGSKQGGNPGALRFHATSDALRFDATSAEQPDIVWMSHCAAWHVVYILNGKMLYCLCT